MRDVSHTPPHDDANAGRRLFGRGVVVATDGGRRGAGDESTATGDAGAADGSVSREKTMAEIDHTPPDGDGARRVWERGLPKPGVHVIGEP